jgi:large subunit ribosomal protein L10
MAITKQKKTEIIDGLVDEIKKSQSVFLVNYEGISVPNDNQFRKSLNTVGVHYKVAKNTLIKKALNECGIDSLDSYLTGVSAVILGNSEDPVLPAKQLVEFLKEAPNTIKTKVINLDGELIDGSKLVDVSKMPGRQELIAQIVSIAAGPGANLVSIIKGPSSTIAGQLKALEEKLEK